MTHVMLSKNSTVVLLMARPSASLLCPTAQQNAAHHHVHWQIVLSARRAAYSSASRAVEMTAETEVGEDAREATARDDKLETPTRLARDRLQDAAAVIEVAVEVADALAKDGKREAAGQHARLGQTTKGARLLVVDRGRLLKSWTLR